MSTSPDQSPTADIDELLAKEDPDFASSLEAVRAVEAAPDVEIEASTPDEEQIGEDELDLALPDAAGTISATVKRPRFLRIKRLRARFVQAGAELARRLLVLLRTAPREFIHYLIFIVKTIARLSLKPVRAFGAADRTSKLLSVALIGVGAVAVWLFAANLKGTWLPSLTRPTLTAFAPLADWVEAPGGDEAQVSFFAAFPQERYEFLFKPFKVNLRRTVDNPQPMGAFEFIVTLDSKDTAIEAQGREVEFADRLQRVFEDETFASLATEPGKLKLKSRIKRELNDTLSNGWVKDVNFKTFVLKP